MRSRPLQPRACARAAGYDARVVTSFDERRGARRRGRDCARSCSPSARALLCRSRSIFGGETTVTVTGGGRGGRNQELALAAALALDGQPDVAVASVGTDGVDGPTDSAGAVADGTSIHRALELGLDPLASLASNDSHTFWRALGDTIDTGPTGTNVMDVVVAVAYPATV